MSPDPTSGRVSAGFPDGAGDRVGLQSPPKTGGSVGCGVGQGNRQTDCPSGSLMDSA